MGSTPGVPPRFHLGERTELDCTGSPWGIATRGTTEILERWAHQGRTSFNVLDIFCLHHEVEALLRGGGDEGLAREEVNCFAERAEVNQREWIAYLRSLALLSEFEGDTQRAIDHLHEAHSLAEKIGVPGELWQIQSRLGELYEGCGEDGQAREAFSGAAQTLRMLAQKIGDEELREGFLSAPQVRRVLSGGMRTPR